MMAEEGKTHQYMKLQKHGNHYEKTAFGKQGLME